jgi:hypothetical protein
MTSTTTRIITIALATFALAAPAASAMPLYAHGEGSTSPRANPDIRTGSLAGTPSTPGQDLRNPDQVAPLPPQVQVPRQDFRNPDNRAPGIETIPFQQPQTMAPVERPKPAPVAVDDSGPSPFVYIIPSVVLIALLGAGYAFMKTSRPVRRSAA